MTKPREALDAYYAEAGSWAYDRQDAMHTSRRIAWIIAAVAVAVALFEAVALMLLTPLKRVEPYTLMVDRQTGFVQLLKPLNPELVTGDAALTQSFLVQYVIAREGFDIDSLDNDYRKVALWSAGTARSDYLTLMPASNPASPLATLPRSSVIDVQVRSVSTLSRDTALVRFETVRRDSGSQSGPPRAWVAVIRFRFSGDPMSAADRFVNPLGFQVVRYRRSAEALPPAQPVQPPRTTISAYGQPPRLGMRQMPSMTYPVEPSGTNLPSRRP